MLQKLPLGRTSALVATRPTNQLSSTLDLKESSCEPEDLDTQGKPSPLGYAGERSLRSTAEVLTAAVSISSGSELHITRSKDKHLAFSKERKPGEACIRSLPHNRANSLNKKRHPTVDFYTIKMELVEHLQNN